MRATGEFTALKRAPPRTARASTEIAWRRCVKRRALEINLAMLLASNLCGAEPRLLVMASGDCQDFHLLESGKWLSGALKARLNEEVIDQAEVVKIFGVPSSRTPQEIQTLLDSARVQYYSSEYAKAKAKVEDALGEIRTLPAGPRHWALYVAAQLLHSLVLKQSGQTEEATAAFRRVLRLDPDLQLDPDYYAPSTCKDFDAVRAEVAGAARSSVSIRSHPSGADVFIDGKNVGTTPFTGDYLPGAYDLVVSKGSSVSRMHVVEIGKLEPIQVDLEFESLWNSREAFCLSEGRAEGAWISGAVKIATLIGTEEVVVARLQRSNPGPSWLTASLVSTETGGKIREAGFKVEGIGPDRSSFEKLADFIVTGKAEGSIVVLDSEKASAPWVPKPVPEIVRKPRSSVNPWQVASYASLAGGGIAASSAVVLLILNEGDRKRLQRYRVPGGAIVDSPESRELVESINARRGLATGLLVASGVVAVSGIAFHILAKRRASAAIELSAAPHRSGAAIFLAGSF